MVSAYCRQTARGIASACRHAVRRLASSDATGAIDFATLAPVDAEPLNGKFVTLRCCLNPSADYIDGLTIYGVDCPGLTLRTVQFEDDDAPTSEDLAGEITVSGWFQFVWHATTKISGVMM